MADIEPTRRLAAILHADVAGYSRLMQEDAQSTVRALNEHRATFSVRVAAHGGRIVNTAGDSLLAEFVAVENAVRCALEVQDALDTANAALPDSRRMLFRIGVNLGDILVDDKGVYGDGVNVAARLESLAAPGGVCVSQAVRDQVLGTLKVAFNDLGEQDVKNMAVPVRAYTVQRSGSGSAAVAPQKYPERQPLSIVVLPFSNVNGDPTQEYLADGITDDLTSDLSRIAGSFVIARNSAFTYKGKVVDLKLVGRELGVSYVLEGSVRRSGDRVRVNARLIDTENGAYVWAGRFDHALGEMLALQDEITGSIARVLRYELIEAASHRSARERRRNPRAIDFLLRAQAIALHGRAPTREAMLAVRELCEQALKLDPDLFMGHVQLASSWTNSIVFGLGEDDAVAIGHAEHSAAQALRLAPGEARVLSTLGNIEVVKRRPELALPYFEAAHETDPNSTIVLRNLGWCKLLLGEAEAAIGHVSRAMRLDPRGVTRANMHGILGTARLYLGHYDEAIHHLGMTSAESPEFAFPRLMTAAAYALSGRINEAKVALNQFRRLRPGVGISRIQAEALSRHPKHVALRERVYEGLKLAGLEE